MNIVYFLFLIASTSSYTFNKVSIPFNNLSSIFNSCFHSRDNRCNHGKNKAEFTLFAKNPFFERKQREQRRSKRLKQVLPTEEMMIDKQINNLIRKSKSHQNKLFGYRLSELPGDGGIIPYLESYGDKLSCVRNYFSAYWGKDKEYVQSVMNDDSMVTSICSDPSKTIGRFKGYEPLVSKFFYRVLEGIFTQEAFVQATFKKTVASVRKHHAELFEGTQNYYGLHVETLFSQLDPEDMDYLRKLEIQVKQGKVDPNFLNAKGESQPGFGFIRDNVIDNIPTVNLDNDKSEN